MVHPSVKWLQILCELVPKGWRTERPLEEMGEAELGQVLAYYKAQAEYEAEQSKA
jgi:hypothetical protein